MSPIRYTFLLFILSIPLANADLPQLSADKPIEFDANTKTLTATSNALLTHDEFNLEADTVTFEQDSFHTSASGDIVLTHPSTRVIADSLDYQFKDKYFDAHNFRLGEPPVYLSGERASGTLDSIRIENPTVTFGEPDWLALNATATSATICADPNYCDETTVVARGIVFKIGKLPFFYAPYYSHCTREIPLSLSSSAGSSSRYGLYTRNSILVDANRQFKWGILLDYYTKRGILAGPTYKIRQPNLYANLDAAFIHDYGSFGNDAQGKGIATDRYFVELQHNQLIRDDIRFIAQVRAWHDSEVLRDFRPSLFKNNQDPENFVEGIYSGDYFTVSLFSRVSPNDFQRVQERLPEFNFDILPTPVWKTPFYHRLNMNYVRLEEKDPKLIDPEVFSDRVDMFYGWHLPCKLTSAILFTPLIGGKVTHYLNSSGEDNSFTRFRAQAGFDLQLNAYGLWDCRNKIWKIDGLRHLVRPIVQYRFTPESNTGTGIPPKIERFFKTSNLPSLDLAYNRNRDESFDSHTVRFGLENSIQTRHSSGYGSRDLASLNLYQDYNLKTHSGIASLSDLFTEFSLNPAYWLKFGLSSRIDPKEITLKELRTQLTLIDGNKWEMTFTTDSLHRETNQYFLHGKWHATHRLALFAHWRYDHKQTSITEQAYGFDARIANSWALSTEVINRRGAKRESKWEVNMVLKLVPFNTEILPIRL